MQTFHPELDFDATAKVLDSRRLFKQIVEAKQLLLGEFATSPIALRWEGYDGALVEYTRALIAECERRKINVSNLKAWLDTYIVQGSSEKPPWLTKDFCYGHRMLLMKKSNFYHKYDWP